MGLSMQTIETAFAGFNTATILAGATASESAGAFLQLSQALGSGVLRGQELNSILEQAPLIAQAIAVEMGSTVGALKKFGEEGKITSEIVIAALGRVEREGAGQLEEALRGPAAAIKDFQNAVEDVQVALTQDIIPEMASSFRELAGIIEDLGPLFRFVGAGVGGALSLAREGISALTLEELRDPAGFARKRIKEGKLPSTFAVETLIGKDRTEELADLARVAVKFGGRNEGLGSERKVLLELLQKEIGMFRLPERGDQPKARPTELSDEEKKRLDKIRQQNILAKTKFFQAQEELAVLLETNEVEKIRLDFAAQRANVQRDYASLIANAKSDEERLNLLGALRNDLQVLSLEQNVAITDEIEKRSDTFSDQLAQQDEPKKRNRRAKQCVRSIK